MAHETWCDAYGIGGSPRDKPCTCVPPSPYRYFHYDRYRNGKIMAEGAVTQALTEEEALKRVQGWYSYADSFRLVKITAGDHHD